MIIIPDIHGRQFWKEAIDGRQDENIIFLGDYMDPYSYEGIGYGQAIANFKDIIEFANSHTNVILLLGNHDCHYLSEDISKGSRFDMWNFPEIVKVFKSYNGQFLMAYEKEINGKNFVFSHAGISRKWTDSHPLLTKGIDFDKINIVEWANNSWEVKDAKFISMLNDVSFRRWGPSDYGSMIWADIMDHYSDNKGEHLIGDYQIFGHTQTESQPLIFDKFAGLDCRRGFILNDEGIILELDRTPAIKANEIK